MPLPMQGDKLLPRGQDVVGGSLRPRAPDRGGSDGLVNARRGLGQSPPAKFGDHGCPIRRAAIALREALILQAVINHPWLLHEHLEELAGVEFRHAEAAKVKGELIDIFAHGGAPDGTAMIAELGRRGLAEASGRILKAITTPSVWGVRPEAAPDDVLTTWKQLVALHRQWHSLTKELRDAEQALGQDATEANYSWLQDVKARLAVLDGTEALIEGFGASSGRPVRSL